MAKTQSGKSTPGGLDLPDAPSLGDCKRYLVKLMRAVHGNRISVKKANCLGQLVNTLIHSIFDAELEDRIARLEQERRHEPARGYSRTVQQSGMA